MSVPLEQDYIGLSEVMSQEENERNKGLNLKATELRLGLPGSESPEREVDGVRVSGKGVEDKSAHPLGVMKNMLVSGAKRGFSDALDNGSKKWVFSGSCGSEVDLAKGGALSPFSPRASNGGAAESKNQQLAAAMKEVVPQSPKPAPEKKPQEASANGHGFAPSAKAQVVGWPPIRSFRKNSMASSPPKGNDDAEGLSSSGCIYVKVGMDGAPYLRKVDLKNHGSYTDLSSALEKMFSCFTIGQCGANGVRTQDGLTESCLKDLLHGSEYVLTYEDKDGDWMLVGDVPWDMFTDSCKRLRIMKSSEAIGLAPRAMEKSRSAKL